MCPAQLAVSPSSTLTDNDGFVRELHHRVKNNFQLIASLVSLQKRMLPPDRRSEARFVEEHVQCMAAAYRIVTVTDTLRQIAGVNRDSVNVELPESDCAVRIDQAVAMGLYLAVLLPPNLDAISARGGRLRVAITLEGPESAVLSIVTAGEPTTPPHPLRRRLTAEYLRQLLAEVDPTTEPGAIRVRIRLLPLQTAHVGGLGPA